MHFIAKVFFSDRNFVVVTLCKVISNGERYSGRSWRQDHTLNFASTLCRSSRAFALFGGKFDENGWYLRGPKTDGAKGILGAATLPCVSSPLGAVPKAGNETRLVIDMGFGYDKLPLQKVSVQPLASINSPDLASRPHFSSITKGGGGGIAVSVNKASGPVSYTQLTLPTILLV